MALRIEHKGSVKKGGFRVDDSRGIDYYSGQVLRERERETGLAGCEANVPSERAGIG